MDRPPLAECPGGDDAWLASFRSARRNDTLAALEIEMAGLSMACPQAWQPQWLLAQSRVGARRFDEAAEPAGECTRRAREADDALGIAWCGNLVGRVLKRAGRWPEAEAAYRETIAAADRAGRPELAAQAQNGLLEVVNELGRLGEGVALLEAAGRNLERAGREDQGRRVRINAAIHALRLGDELAADRILTRVLDDARRDGDLQTISRASLTRGDVERRRGNLDAAAEWYGRVPPSDAEARFFVELNLGLIDLARGRAEHARRRLEAAVPLAPDPAEALFARIWAAGALLRTGRVAAAARRLAALVAEADAGGAVDPAWISRWLLARARLAAGETDAALPALRRSVDLLERQGDSVDPVGAGLRYLEQRKEPYADLAAVLAGTSERPTAEALALHEKVHARALRRIAAAPRSARTRRDAADWLAEGELLLDFVIGEERGALIASTASASRSFALPGWKVLRGPLREYRSALTRPLRSAEARLDPLADLSRSTGAVRELSRVLLEPVDEWIAASRRIYWVPDGELARLPPAALRSPAGGEYLGTTHEIAILPYRDRPARFRLRGSVLLAGDPLPDAAGRYPSLARASAELEALAGLYRNRAIRRLERDGLTPEALLAQPLGEFGLLHFATHAEASTVDPSRCAVFLSEGRRVGLETIATWRLSSPLVVLSACRGGEGEVVAGEGVVGLVWAFLRSGADAVAASLWNVEDESAGALMTRFHGGVSSHGDPVAAMADAGRAIARERPHPAYWAPFVVVLRPGSGR